MELGRQFWESEEEQEQQKAAVRREVNVTNIEFVRDITDITSSARLQNTINGEDEVLSTEFTKESKKIGIIESKAKLDRKESENISGSDSEAEKLHLLHYPFPHAFQEVSFGSSRSDISHRQCF